MKKTILHIALFLLAGSFSYGQNKPPVSERLDFHINSLHQTSFKKTKVQEPNVNNRLRLWDGQLMYWPFYPSTAQQIENRLNGNNQSVPQYLISEVVTTLINARKNSRKPSGQIPRF